MLTNQKLKLRQNSKPQIVKQIQTSLSKLKKKVVTKHKNSNCDKTQMSQKSKIQIVAKLKL